MNLEDIRRTIDTVDTDIVSLIAKRIRLSKEAAIAKKEGRSAIHDPARESAVLTRVRSCAAKEHLDTSFIHDLYMLILAHSNRIQHEI